MTDQERARFDALLERALAALPERVRSVIEETSLVVDDVPEPELASSLYSELAQARGEDLKQFSQGLCGLHTGVPLTNRSVSDHGEMPTEIRIFREGIVFASGGWEAVADEAPSDIDDSIYDEIIITILHEVGHHFGLEEDDLEALGFG